MIDGQLDGLYYSNVLKQFDMIRNHGQQFPHTHTHTGTIKRYEREGEKRRIYDNVRMYVP